MWDRFAARHIRSAQDALLSSQFLMTEFREVLIVFFGLAFTLCEFLANLAAGSLFKQQPCRSIGCLPWEATRET